MSEAGQLEAGAPQLFAPRYPAPDGDARWAEEVSEPPPQATLAGVASFA
jgi:hypothetical protein